MMTYSDDILRQFLDGARDQATANEIETAMLSDADLAARIMGLDDLAASVRAVMETLPPKARVAALAPETGATPTRPSRPWAMLSAACALCLIRTGDGAALTMGERLNLASADMAARAARIHDPIMTANKA